MQYVERWGARVVAAGATRDVRCAARVPERDFGNIEPQRESTMQMHQRLAAAAAVVVVGGCASAGYDKPYAIIESGSVQDVSRQTPVIIERIDGSSPMRGHSPPPVEPGRRVVEVSSVGRSNAKSLVQTVIVEAEPCVRYRLAAQYDSRLDLEWKPVLQWYEDIGECRAKFFGGATKK